MAHLHRPLPSRLLVVMLACQVGSLRATAGDPPHAGRSWSYANRLVPIENPTPLLADYPEFVQPIVASRRLEAPILINEPHADLSVRAWRFSYNARAIIEVPNRLRADHTAVVMVHPWGIDDGQGWRTPEPAGAADFCTPAKNRLAARHTRQVVNPLLKRLRSQVALVLYSLRGEETDLHRLLYRSVRHRPTEAERRRGAKALRERLARFDYRSDNLPATLTISDDHSFRDYFRQFPGLDAGPRYDHPGFWDLPIPICREVDVDPSDVVYYDRDGYGPLRDFLKEQHVRHVLLTGYATDMCFCSTTAGYQNLSKDFNVFLVGDATLATFPANATPRYATNAHISFASLNEFITQTSWIRSVADAGAEHSGSPEDR